MQAIFALMTRTLNQDCRQWSTALLRSLSVVLLLLTVAVLNLNSTLASGLWFASWLQWMNYVGITLASFSWFAAAIAEERELRTLALLRMTNLNGAAILLGKWLPRVVVIQVLILVQLPMAVLAVTMGGVTPTQLIASNIGLMAYAIMMSAIALLWSVVCGTARRACWFVGLCWFGMVAGPSIVKLILPTGFFGADFTRLTGIRFAPWVYDWVEKIHMASMLRKNGWVLTIGDTEAWIDWQVVSNLSVALAAFLLAWFCFERFALYNLEAPVKSPVRISRPFRGRRRKLRGSRPKHIGRAWPWAVAWKEFSYMTGGWGWIVTKLIFYPGLILMVIGITSSAGGTSFRDTWNTVGPQMLVSIGGFGFLAEFAGMCGRIFGAEIHGGTIQQIITLPTTIARIGYQKVAGGLLAMLPALCTLVVGASLDPQVLVPVFRFLLSTGGLATITAYLVFVHVCVYLSIHIRSGAVVLAFFMMWVAASLWNALFFILIGMGPKALPKLEMSVIVVGLFICAILQWRIGRDVVRKATT